MRTVPSSRALLEFSPFIVTVHFQVELRHMGDAPYCPCMEAYTMSQLFSFLCVYVCVYLHVLSCPHWSLYPR